MIGKNIFCFFVIFIIGCSSTPQGENISNIESKKEEINDLADIEKLKLSKDVLVVFDIDDTLLTSNKFFGSDRWYDWQNGKAHDHNGEVIEIDKNNRFSCIFDVLGIINEISTNTLTQDNAPDIFNGVEQDKLILTARSDKYRASTMRELDKNGFNLDGVHLKNDGRAVNFEVTHAGRKANVSYYNGVFMVEGMNKGVMLKQLLEKIGKSYQKVVLIDDKIKNINNMRDSMLKNSVHFVGLHYIRIDKSVSLIDISEGNKAANDLIELMKNYFPGRYKRFKSNDCSYQ